MQGHNIKRIAFINFGGLGDEILFSPVIAAVREAFPTADLSLILESRSAGIREMMPQLDELITLNIQALSKPKLFQQLLQKLKAGKFDAVISSGSNVFIPVLLKLSGIPIRVGFDTGRISQMLLTHPAKLDQTGYAGDMYFSLARAFLPGAEFVPHVAPILSVPDDRLKKAEALFAQTSPHKPSHRILIHPGVSRLSVEKNILKAWDISNWADLLHQLPIRYPEAHFYILGGPDDAEVIEALEAVRERMASDIRVRVFNMYGKTGSLLDLAGLIKLGDLMISVDSAPLHLAIGLGTPVVALFSPTDEKKLVPHNAQVAIAARFDLPCRPCLWDVRQTSCETPLCLDIPVSMVVEKIDTMLKNKVMGY